MSCEQKSGVFLMKSCSQKDIETCINCEKKICQLHLHHLEASVWCEDCYWEKFLYAEGEKQVDDSFDDDSGTIISTSETYSTSNSEESGFDGGFGGGGFGGGGASASWTEGDAQGFNETDAAGGLLDNDDTFYYS